MILNNVYSIIIVLWILGQILKLSIVFQDVLLNHNILDMIQQHHVFKDVHQLRNYMETQ